MAGGGNSEPDSNIGSDFTEVENVTGVLCLKLSWTAPIVGVIGHALFYFWARKVQDINPYVIPLMGNVILLALYINITAIVTYHMKISKVEASEFMTIGVRTFMSIIILCLFLYLYALYDDKFVESSTYSSPRKNI